MKKGLFLATITIFAMSICLGPNMALATVTTENSNVSSVSSIALEAGSAGVVEWETVGNSSQGFKVVWSKNENPTYPCREGDQYHYYSESSKDQDELSAFSGAGTYYVRVCEYLGGKCGKYSNQVSVELGGAVACTMEYAPVCGKDGKTYGNKCMAEAAGTTKAYYGECESTVAKEEKPTVNSVSAIVLKGDGPNVVWESDGYSVQGYKVVWSKNENPTYPTREGDQYHYRSNPNMNSDYIAPFSGAGTYYVRVCEYLGGSCGIYSNQITVQLGDPASKPVQEMEQIREKAGILYENKIDQLLGEIQSLRSLIREQQVQLNHLMRLKEGLVQTINAAIETAIKNFITYGVDDNTKKLGEGERAAVMYSFKEAFGKLPETEDEIEEAIKIANGRFPSIVSDEAEAEAKTRFQKIYLRVADMNNAHDAAAIKVMAYGLRQKAENRNLKSEAAALKTFKNIFKKLPQTTEEWNALQAITYSGATR